MSDLKGFAFVTPDDIDAENPKNIHIFQGTYDTNQCKFYRQGDSLCGKCRTKSNWSFFKKAVSSSKEEAKKASSTV